MIYLSITFMVHINCENGIRKCKDCGITFITSAKWLNHVKNGIDFLNLNVGRKTTAAYRTSVMKQRPAARQQTASGYIP
jgi:hypothetical protein